ncbi:MAG: ATP-binding protein [Geminicoccaceae bacterium]
MRRLFASPLSRSFAFKVIMASTMITLVITLLQLWFDYETNIASTHDALAQVQASYSSSLTSSLWTYDDVLVQSQLDGITNLLEVEWAEIVTDGGSRWISGEPKSKYTFKRDVPLIYGGGTNANELGRLTLVSSLDSIYWDLAKKFTIILSLNFIKTLCMSLVIIYLFHRLVGRHLIDLAAFLSSLNLRKRSSDFTLRDRRHRSSADELDLLVDTINLMRAKVQSSYDNVAENRDQLEAALQKERELNSLQRQFVSMVSHEFRTPLAIIDGNAQRLQRKKSKITQDKLSDMLTTMRKSVRRLVDLMESVLSSARLEEGEIGFDPSECNIAGLLQEVCAGYRELHAGYDIQEDLGRLPKTITADSRLLRQVFSNLVSNAVKYAPDGKSIWVTGLQDSQGNIAVSVRDEGVGIPEEELENLFERFFRASTATGIPGTGIGLHLVRHLVKMHGGSISVESRPGEGATFTVRLPGQHTATQKPIEDERRHGAEMVACKAAAQVS